MQTLRMGVVGCGEIAQIMHLPYLKELPQFEIGAICDLSTSVVDAVGNSYGVKHRYTDYRDLLARNDLDAVAVLTIDHADIAEAAAEAGKHVFVEKPLCFNPADGERVLSAARRNHVTLMVGYMKRYDPGYEYGRAHMQALDDVRLIRVHDFSGRSGVHRPLYTLVRGDDIPQERLDAGRNKIRNSMKAALGASHEHLSDLYGILLGLCSHDLTILRGVFGAPKGVLYSDALSPTEIVSVLDYGPRRRYVFEAGTWPDYLWWDEQLTAYGRDQIVSIAFPNPWVKYAPTVVTIRENDGDAPVRKEIPASHHEAFRLEWLHFHESVSETRHPRTTGEDGKADVELAAEMIRAVQV